MDLGKVVKFWGFSVDFLQALRFLEGTEEILKEMCKYFVRMLVRSGEGFGFRKDFRRR